MSDQDQNGGAISYIHLCECGKRLRIRERNIGEWAHCPRCNNRFLALPENSEPGSDSPRLSTEHANADFNTPAHNFDFQPGQVLWDSYVVQELLGEGGMGKVHKVYHRGWNAELALKAPKPAILADVQSTMNFERECQTWVDLGLHPHLVSCYYIRRLHDVPLLLIEYVAGGTLATWIRNGAIYEGGPKRAFGRVVDIAIQFAWGLDYAHQQGLVHQDVKPANAMMTPQGVLKVTDFGLARARELSGEKRGSVGQNILVSSGGMTPAYCSPEQASAQPLDSRTDIWSWALSVLEMLTGSVTWLMGQTAALVLEEYLKNVDERNSRLPEIPDSLAQLLKNCFESNPQQRPENMQVVADRLQELYFEVTGEFYPRGKPEVGEEEGYSVKAGNLNNRAISMIELGQHSRAFERFSEAKLAAHAGELLQPLSVSQEIAYNLALLQLRSHSALGLKTGTALVPKRPDEVKYAYFTGMLLLESGDLHKAIDNLSSVIQTTSKYKVDALTVRGIALLLIGETRPAILSFREALRLTPERLDAKRNLALAYYYDGRIFSCLRIYSELLDQGSLDNEDRIRLAVLLNAAAQTQLSLKYLKRALGELTRSSTVLLSAAELCAGIQTFLPGVIPMPLEAYPKALIREVLDSEVGNLRAAIDLETYPKRFALWPSVGVRWRGRLIPEDPKPVALGNALIVSHETLSKETPWGNLPACSERTKCLILAGIIPLVLAWTFGRALTQSDVLITAFEVNPPRLRLGLWTVFTLTSVFLIARPVPRKYILGDVLLLCFALPFLFYLPTIAHGFFVATFIGETSPIIRGEHVHYIFLFSCSLSIVLVTREVVYQRLIARARAGIPILPWVSNPHGYTNVSPDNEGLAPPDAPRVDTVTRDGQEKDKIVTGMFQVFLRRLASIGKRTSPQVKAWVGKTQASFGLWQLLLLPEFLGMVFADSIWAIRAAQDHFIFYILLMGLSHFLLLAYTAITPRFFLTANFFLCILVGASITGELFVSTSLWSFLVFFFLSLFFLVLNALAIQFCPEFAARWRGPLRGRWELNSVVDPLNIRQYAAPWQLVKSD